MVGSMSKSHPIVKSMSYISLDYSTTVDINELYDSANASSRIGLFFREHNASLQWSRRDGDCVRWKALLDDNLLLLIAIRSRV